MSATMACIAGEEIHRQYTEGRFAGRPQPPRDTPFGKSGRMFLVDLDGREVYLLPRYGAGLGKTAHRAVNHRANLYALKDLGVQCVLAWGPCGAVTHNVAVGDLVILDDLIDRTYLRDKTFFENSPLGFLRQFPVFCPTLRGVLEQVLGEMKLVHHPAGAAAVMEGPRLETPAEVRMLATIGAELVTHTFVPEVFLAKELQMCYAGLCYVVNYAETGSRHRPFAAGDLFGGLTQRSDRQRLKAVTGSMTQIVRHVAEALEARRDACECTRSMAGNIAEYDLSDDWREWFAYGRREAGSD